MATSNFYYYDNLPNLFFKTFGELLDIAYYARLSEDDEQKYIDDQCKKYRILDEIEYDELKDYIEKMNDIIENKANSYRSDKYDDQADLLHNMHIDIESGHYEGLQIYLNNYRDYSYLNKTNQKLIKSLFMKIAKRFHLYDYTLAYRFSNGETAFSLIKKY